MNDEHIIRIMQAVQMQSEDQHLWILNPETYHEDLVMQALRDLHRVIEGNDKEAFARITYSYERSKDL